MYRLFLYSHLCIKLCSDLYSVRQICTLKPANYQMIYTCKNMCIVKQFLFNYLLMLATIIGVLVGELIDNNKAE